MPVSAHRFLPEGLTPLASRRSAWVAELLQRPAREPAVRDTLRPILASLLAGRACAQGVLPARLGLPEADFARMMGDYFPGESLELADGGVQESDELWGVIRLLEASRAGHWPSELWLARIVAWGCAGHQHLWQALGLACRDELSLLMTTAFPTLAALNTTQMKWKKFIHLQTCRQAGINAAAPASCRPCAEFVNCYPSEL